MICCGKQQKLKIMIHQVNIGGYFCFSQLFLYICGIKTIIKLCANMNAKEIALIEAIIDKSDKKRHEKALKLLLYGEDRDGSIIKNEYVNCLEALVRKKIGNNISFNDSYSVFATEFWMHLEKMTPEQLRSINNLKSWLFIVAKNFIETIRKEMEVFQLMDTPVDEDRLAGSADDNSEGEAVDFDADNIYDAEDNGDECHKQSQEVESIETVPFDENEQERLQRLDFAKWRFRYYLSKMLNETYKDLLFAVYIEGVDRESLAEEYGWSMDVLNLTLDHARNAFIAVTLEDIRRCEPELFKKYEYHKDMDEKTAILLREFFIYKYDVQQLAHLHHKSNYEIKKLLSVAYKKLLRIHKNETELKEIDSHQEEKKQKRMKRLFGMYKGVLKKKYPKLFWWLLKYYEEFQGNYSAMTEWALNNNANIEELEQYLETSFDVLNAIDKESNEKKYNIDE